jgi:hypothetical protein
MFSSNSLLLLLTILACVFYILHTPQNGVEGSYVVCPVCAIGNKGDSQYCQVNTKSAICLGCDYDHTTNVTTINCDARNQGGLPYSPTNPCSTLLSDSNK